MANKLNTQGIAAAFAILTAISYIICFAIVFIFGEASLKFFNLFFHGIDLASLATNPNITTAFIGLIISVIVAYIYGYIFAFVYNKFAK